MKKLLFSIGTVFLFYSVNAQIIVEQIEPGSIGSTLQTRFENAPVIEMPEFNYKWIEEEEKEPNVPYVRPPRFGYAYETKINNSNDGKWTQEGNVSIWTLSIKSKGALSINLIFDEFFLSEGSEFNIYNNTKTMRFGPVSSKHNKSSRKLATDIIKGSSVTLVLTEPNTLENIRSIISVKYVIHGFAAYCDFGDATLDCHINANCPQANDLADEKYAVARILLNYGQRCCSGSLINNASTCPDFTPYFLTAFHCIDLNEDRSASQYEKNTIENWVFSYNYISPNCTPSSEPSSWISYSGAFFRAYNSETDFLLVEMDDQPEGSTGITYAGWSRDDDFPFLNEGTSSLHHPGGDVMKFSSDIEEPEVNEDPVRFYYHWPDSYWDSDPGTLWVVEFDNGSIEGGSSGGPLFDPNNRIIGQTVGTEYPWHCPPVTGFYGRFSESWAMSQNNDEQLAHWLDPDNTGAMTTNTIGIPYITGPDFVCYSPSETFTLHNRPSGTNVNWTYNTSLLYPVSGQGTNNFIVRAKTSYVNGEGWVQANISKDGCDPISFRLEDFWVGRFQNTWVFGTPRVCPNTTYTYTALVPFGNPSSYTYSWTYPSNWTKLSKYQNNIQLRTPSNPYYGTVRVSITNPCGASDYSGITVYPGYCGGYFRVFPNPADDYVEISIDESKLAENKIDEYEVRIYNSMNIMVSQTRTRKPTLRINIRQFINGIYTVHFITGDKLQVEQLVISH